MSFDLAKSKALAITSRLPGDLIGAELVMPEFLTDDDVRFFFPDRSGTKFHSMVNEAVRRTAMERGAVRVSKRIISLNEYLAELGDSPRRRGHFVSDRYFIRQRLTGRFF